MRAALHIVERVRGKGPYRLPFTYSQHRFILTALRLADSALSDAAAWNGVKYNFVMGVHPHEAKDYNDDVEAMILEAMEHVRSRLDRERCLVPC